MNQCELYWRPGEQNAVPDAPALRYACGPSGLSDVAADPDSAQAKEAVVQDSYALNGG